MRCPMRKCSIALVLMLMSVAARATDTEATVSYQWGVFNPVNGKIILVPWNTKEGKRRLTSSRFNDDFYQLASHYQAQLTPVYAGVASAVIVLNAFRLPKHAIKSQKESEIAKPKAMGAGVIPFPAYNQINFFNERTDAVKDRKVLGLLNATSANESDKAAFKPGTSLAELKGLLEVYGLGAEVHEASGDPKSGTAAFRKTLKEVLKDDKRFVLANFKGDAMGATTEGTVSPLAAYDEKTDSVLVLDVTGHKNPWYWAPVEAFYLSMHTQYGDGIWRGYMIVSDSGKE